MNAYTSLRVINEGIVVFEQHRARLFSHPAFDDFSRDANNGNYTLQIIENVLHVSRFESSKIYDSIACRYLRSPIVNREGFQTKQAPPNAWSEVRIPNVATLLTQIDDDEILESCSATVLAFENGVLTAVPDERPRIRSTAEIEILRCLPHQKKPILRQHQWPFVLVNAVALVVVPEQTAPPTKQMIEPLLEVLLRSAKRQ